MKIGIITIDKCNNYGAELQAYATVQALRKLGYDAELIDYLYFKNPEYKACTLSKPLASFPLKKRILDGFKYGIVTKVLHSVIPLVCKDQKNRNRRFMEFHEINTKTSPTYRSIKELYNCISEYDVYMAGSDQIWNPYTESNLSPYFLQFAPKGAKRISYASSFGVAEIPSFAVNKYKMWLGEMQHISCRESTGAIIVKQLIGRDAFVALDPTLLLNKEQWLDIKGVRLIPPQKYVLIYEVSGASPYISRMAIEYGKKHHIPIYRICTQAIGNKKEDGIINIVDAGPADFVQLFAMASFVLTNSFHGTAFSCNFGLNFHAVLFKNNSKNTRILSLLEKLQLKSRIVWGDEKYPSDFGQPYDVGVVHKLLTNERRESINYLVKAVES